MAGVHDIMFAVLFSEQSIRCYKGQLGGSQTKLDGQCDSLCQSLTKDVRSMKSLSSCRSAGIKYCRLFVFCAMLFEVHDADDYGSKYCEGRLSYFRCGEPFYRKVV